jgi:hypothetical protein
MAERRPRPISAATHRAGQRRVLTIAHRFGFVGRVEYRHAHSNAGGAQYGRAVAQENDVLVVFAKAFNRDADPDDFSKQSLHMNAATRSQRATSDSHGIFPLHGPLRQKKSSHRYWDR